MTDLDTLMERIEAINAKDADKLTPDDIDELIYYHRRNRERKASGGKPLKPAVDLSAIMAKVLPAAPTVKITRRF